MTRGKYAAKAAVRQAEVAVATDLATYQHAVKRLTAENADLKKRLAESQRAHAEDVRVLKAQLREGLSPELAARDQEIQKLRDKVDQLSRKVKETTSTHERVMGRFVAALRAEGWTGTDALALAINDTNRVASVESIRALKKGKQDRDVMARALLAKSGSENAPSKTVRPQDDPEWMARFHAELGDEEATA